MPETIRLYLDFASPYAYFALDAAEKLAAQHGRVIVWRPILLWAVLKAHGIAPPMDSAPKRAYFLADMARSAAYYGVPYAAPDLPLSSHKAARLYYALEARDPDLSRSFGHDVFTSLFAERADITDIAVLARLASRRGISENVAIAAVESEIGRRGLSEAVEEAIAAGVCGSPWFLVEGEAFFGADRLPQLAWRLAGR